MSAQNTKFEIYIHHKRFAEDIFSVLWSQFQLPREIVSAPTLPVNKYKSYDDLCSVVTAVNCCQVVLRPSCFNIFVPRFSQTEIVDNDLFVFITSVINFISADPHGSKEVNIFMKCIQTFTVPVELALFFVFKGIKFNFQHFPQFWVQFFTSHLSEQFCAAGGFDVFFEECAKFHCDDSYFKTLFSNHPVSYNKAFYKKYLIFEKNYGHQTSELMKDSSKVLKDSYLLDSNDMDWRPHPKLGIIPHERRFPKDLFQSSKSETESSIKSVQRKSSLSADERQKRKREKLRLKYYQKTGKLAEEKYNRQQSPVIKDLDMNPLAKLFIYDVSSQKCPESGNMSPKQFSPNDHASFKSLSPYQNISNENTLDGSIVTGKERKVGYSQLGARPNDINSRDTIDNRNNETKHISKKGLPTPGKVKSISSEDNSVSRKVKFVSEVNCPVSPMEKSAIEKDLSGKNEPIVEENCQVLKERSVTGTDNPAMGNAKSAMQKGTNLEARCKVALSQLTAFLISLNKILMSNPPTEGDESTLKKVMYLRKEGDGYLAKAKSFIVWSNSVSSCDETSVSNQTTNVSPLPKKEQLTESKSSIEKEQSLSNGNVVPTKENTTNEESPEILQPTSKESSSPTKEKSLNEEIVLKIKSLTLDASPERKRRQLLAENSSVKTNKNSLVEGQSSETKKGKDTEDNLVSKRQLSNADINSTKRQTLPAEASSLFKKEKPSSAEASPLLKSQFLPEVTRPFQKITLTRCNGLWSIRL